MVARAIAESADVKQWELLLTAKRAKLPQIEGLLRRGKEDPAYINRQEEIAREQQSLDEVKQKMVAPIQREVELSLRSKRTDSQVATLARRREEVARNSPRPPRL